MGFLDSGWSIANGRVLAPSKYDPWTAYRFILEAIYDGHLPITRIIGYHVTTSNSARTARSSRIVERDQNCADDRLTIASNLTNILFVDYTKPKAHVEEHTGVMRVSEIEFTYSRKPIPVLTTQDYMLTSLAGVSMDLTLSTSTGYKDANENYTKIMSSKIAVSRTRYFPLFSYHNIIDFVKVLPFTGKDIILRYEYGMTDAYLTEIFEQLFIMKLDNNWCSKYREILV